jgi:hypothetical protein
MVLDDCFLPDGNSIVNGSMGQWVNGSMGQWSKVAVTLTAQRR